VQAPDKERQAARVRLGAALRQARRWADVSQKAAAERLGISRPTLSDWENGKAEPLAVDLERLALLYGLGLDQVAGRAPFPLASE
jgi:transcriptional regulator with XRE-family HTH domain